MLTGIIGSSKIISLIIKQMHLYFYILKQEISYNENLAIYYKCSSSFLFKEENFSESNTLIHEKVRNIVLEIWKIKLRLFLISFMSELLFT